MIFFNNFPPTHLVARLLNNFQKTKKVNSFQISSCYIFKRERWKKKKNYARTPSFSASFTRTVVIKPSFGRWWWDLNLELHYIVVCDIWLWVIILKWTRGQQMSGPLVFTQTNLSMFWLKIQSEICNNYVCGRCFTTRGKTFEHWQYQQKWLHVWTKRLWITWKGTQI